MTRLILIRHAEAEPPPEVAWNESRSDVLRQLTPEGGQRMRRGGYGLSLILPETVGLIATSPLTRAVQTARILAEYFPTADFAETPLLSPGVSPQSLSRWVVARHTEIILLVGHEPDLSQLAGWFITGSMTSILDMKKGAACLLETDLSKAGGGHILWFLLLKELECLGTPA